MKRRAGGQYGAAEDGAPGPNGTGPPARRSSPPERAWAIDAVMAVTDFGDTDEARAGALAPAGIFLPALPPWTQTARRPGEAPAEGVSGALLVGLLNQFTLVQQQMFDQFQQVMLAMIQNMTAVHREQADLIRQELAQVAELTRQLCALQAGTAAAPAAVAPPAREAVALPRLDAPAPAAAAPAPPPGSVERADPAVHLWLTQRIAAIQAERQGRLHRVLGVLLGRT
jgi:hypothetical protein